jgi:hypothetical protein
MDGKPVLFLLTSLLLVFLVNLQPVASQLSTPSQTPSPTQEPSPTPASQVTPVSPWELMLLVFVSVGLAAVVVSVMQRLRRNVAK